MVVGTPATLCRLTCMQCMGRWEHTSILCDCVCLACCARRTNRTIIKASCSRHPMWLGSLEGELGPDASALARYMPCAAVSTRRSICAHVYMGFSPRSTANSTQA